MSVEVLRAADRFVTREDGRTTYHCFSYGAHYDPSNVAFGPLVAVNEEVLPAGTGYDAHRHVDTEIVTWVLDGALHHASSHGPGDGGEELVLPAGTVQVATAGTGISHIERAGGVATRFLQMMLRPDATGVPPATERVSVVGTIGMVAVPVPLAGARLLVGSVLPGPMPLPAAPLVHVFVVSGLVRAGGEDLSAGDSARLRDDPARELVVVEPSALCVWAFGGS